GWIVMLAVVGVFGLGIWRRDSKRRRAGLVAPPANVTLLKIGGVLAGGVGLVLLCNTDRGVIVPIRGVPWVVLLVVGVLVGWTILLGRPRLGRYMYAIVGKAEPARPAGGGLLRRLEELDRVAGAVVEHDLLPARPGHDLAAEGHSCLAQPVDLGL